MHPKTCIIFLAITCIAISFATSIKSETSNHSHQKNTAETLSYLVEDEIMQPYENCKIDEFHNLINKDKYEVDNFTTTTEDGHILQMFRVKLKDSELKKLDAKYDKNVGKPILMVHGLFNSSDSWFLSPDDKALSQYLINYGYTVWFGNNRGNKYSLAHVRKDIKEGEFYDYSYDELGKYDIKAFYKEIEKETENFDKVIYIGYSQGTVQMSVALLDQPNDGFVAQHTSELFYLAPPHYMKHVGLYTIKQLAHWGDHFKVATDGYKIYEMRAPMCAKLSPYSYSLMKIACRANIYLCPSVAHHLKDNERSSIKDRVASTFQEPSGASLKCLEHFGQLVHESNANVFEDCETEPVFRKYDHGPQENMKRFGQEVPPNYSFEHWPDNLKLHLLVADHDTLATLEDNAYMVKKLESYHKHVTSDTIHNSDHLSINTPNDAKQVFQVFDRELGNEIMRPYPELDPIDTSPVFDYLW